MGIESFTLDNGMAFHVIVDSGVPAISLGFFVRAGSCEEPGENRGVAHFLEHMMFKGSANVKAGEYSETVDKAGGHCNAYTSSDATVYHSLVPTHLFETVFRMEADRPEEALVSGQP